MSKKVINIINNYKKILLNNDILLTFKEYKRNSFDLSDDLDIIPTDKYYLEYIIYLKNIHNKRVKPSKYVYHFAGKSEYIRDKILKDGLIPQNHSNSEEWSKEIYLEYPSAIFAVDGDKEVWREGFVFQIDTQGLSNKWWEDLNFDGRRELIMTFEPIPVSNIKLIKKTT